MSDFPADFLWGAATSAYQIEGGVGRDGRGESVWDVFARQPGAIEGGGDGSVSADSYQRWREDVDILDELGVNAYRFSIGWSRILPTGRGRVEQRGLDHYDRLVDELVARGIEPVVTLNHWDMPQDLMKDGGWIGRSSIDAFAQLTQAVRDRIGDRVTWWITQNEPWIIALLGYHLGLHAPGHANLRDSVKAGHHVLLGHGAAADILHELPHARVGAALSLYPCDPATDTEADRAAAWGSDGYVNRWYLDPLLVGRYPRDMREHFERAVGPLDFIKDGDEEAIGSRSDYLGVNYYTRRIMQAVPVTAENPFPWRVIQSRSDVPRSDLNWEITPDSLRDLLLRLSRDYPNTPLMITENGAAFGDTPRHDGRVHDVRRQKFIVDHLKAIQEAIAHGADVRGYLHWSLLDNFEWALGYRPRFGLVYVDYPTGERTIKDSARLYSQIIRNQKLPTKNIEGELLS